MVDINTLLQAAVARQASDLHLTVGVPPMLRVKGSLLAVNSYPALTCQDTETIVAAITDTAQQARFRQFGELDFSYELAGLSRFRVNIFRQRCASALAIRVVLEQIPTLEQLGQPEVLKMLARKPRGLVLVTGPAGSGKSTTLAAMVDLINTEQAHHIITLEDPIEYVHKHKKSIINQREISVDTKSFASALRAALREDPDVILIGEMRDSETIGIAITAAETGHLVFATMHTGNAIQTLDRIIDGFPADQQPQIRTQLSLTLQGIVAQQLLPRCDGSGRIAAVEVLLATPAVRNLIREGKTHQLAAVMQTGVKSGMLTMDMALRDLYLQGLVAYDTALNQAIDQETFTCLATRA